MLRTYLIPKQAISAMLFERIGDEEQLAFEPEHSGVRDAHYQEVAGRREGLMLHLQAQLRPNPLA